MTEHVTNWLEAYHDGELRGRRLHQVEVHLSECGTCRQELERLRALTALLVESPAAVGLTSPERFVAQVGLRLPRRPPRPLWQTTLEIGWQLTPVGLFGAWAFLQAVFLVAGVILLAGRLGLVGDVLAGLLPAPTPAPWWSGGISGLLGAGLSDVSRIVLYLLGDGSPLGWGITLHLVSLVVIGLLYWSWLASWWVRCRRQRLQGC
jgi:anti-sigma factor RsiW